MGNMKDLMGMIPGMGKAMKGVDVDDDGDGIVSGNRSGIPSLGAFPVAFAGEGLCLMMNRPQKGHE